MMLHKGNQSKAKRLSKCSPSTPNSCNFRPFKIKDNRVESVKDNQQNKGRF